MVGYEESLRPYNSLSSGNIVFKGPISLEKYTLLFQRIIAAESSY